MAAKALIKVLFHKIRMSKILKLGIQHKRISALTDFGCDDFIQHILNRNVCGYNALRTAVLSLKLFGAGNTELSIIILIGIKPDRILLAHRRNKPVTCTRVIVGIIKVGS